MALAWGHGSPARPEVGVAASAKPPAIVIGFVGGFIRHDNLVHRGRAEIRSDDPSRTQIVGNYRFDYDSHPVRCVGYPWFAIAFEYSHIEIECDPNILNRLESLIRSKLPAGTKSSAGSQ